MLSTNEQEKDIKSNTPKIDTSPTAERQILQTISSNMDSIHAFLGILSDTKIPILTNYDSKEDFEFYASGQLNLDSFKGKYVAIWRKQVAGNGDTAVEAERMAKYYHENSRPAIVYVPENDESIL